MIRPVTALATAASIALAASHAAADYRNYVSLGVAHMMPDDTGYTYAELDRIDPNLGFDEWDVDAGDFIMDDSLSFRAAFGHQLTDRFALEAEVASRKTDITHLTRSEYGEPAEKEPFSPALGVSSMSFMVNATYSVPTGLKFLTPYAGAGFGHAKVEVDDIGSASAPAWQIMAGARFPLSERIEVTLEYRHFRTGNLDHIRYNEDGDHIFTEGFSSREIGAGLVFRL